MDYSKFGFKKISNELNNKQVIGNPDFVKELAEMKLIPTNGLLIAGVEFSMEYIDNREPDTGRVVDYYVNFSSEFYSAAEALLPKAVDELQCNILVIKPVDYENCVRYALSSLFTGRSPIAKEFGLRVGDVEAGILPNSNVCRIEYLMIIQKGEVESEEEGDTEDVAYVNFGIALSHGVADEKAEIVNYGEVRSILMLLNGETVEENMAEINKCLKL